MFAVRFCLIPKLQISYIINGLKEVKFLYIKDRNIQESIKILEELADKMSDLAINGKSDIAFVIGGSLGLSPEVSERSNYKLSFSKMTFPHQMMRVVLLEQIYRSFKINEGSRYHK